MQKLFLAVLIISVMIMDAEGQVTGLWISTDHVDATEKSIVAIYETNGKLYGRIEKLLPAATITHCTGCEGTLKNKSLVGMVIMNDFDQNGNKATDGKILDPSNGKWYSCDIELASADRLKVTGYVGLPMLGKTMYWNRVK